MKSPSNTPQDYGHPDNDLDGNQMSETVEHGEPTETQSDPQAGEDSEGTRQDAPEVSGVEAAGPPSFD